MARLSNPDSFEVAAWGESPPAAPWASGPRLLARRVAASPYTHKTKHRTTHKAYVMRLHSVLGPIVASVPSIIAKVISHGPSVVASIIPRMLHVDIVRVIWGEIGYYQDHRTCTVGTALDPTANNVPAMLQPCSRSVHIPRQPQGIVQHAAPSDTYRVRAVHRDHIKEGHLASENLHRFISEPLRARSVVCRYLTLVNSLDSNTSTCPALTCLISRH